MEEEDDEDIVELNVVGITYSQVQQGAYALVLGQADGPYRIPIVVGTAEAQAIAVRLENIIPPRPMPHDLLVSVSHAFGLQLERVFINRFSNGVFMSELTFSSDDRCVSIDSRTSDAIALALRTGAPIFTTTEIMEQTGFKINDKRHVTVISPAAPQASNTAKKERARGQSTMEAYQAFSLGELEKLMQSYVDKEEYEMAAEVKRAIEAKKKSS